MSSTRTSDDPKHDSPTLARDRIHERVEAVLSGVSAEEISQEASREAQSAPHGLVAADAARIAWVALAAGAVYLRAWEPLPRVSLIGVLGLSIGGWPLLREAAQNLRARRMTMELSMSIAIVAAAAIAEFFTALVITLFVLVAEVLEGMTVSRGRRAIHDLLHFLPQMVCVRRAGLVRDIPLQELRIGDLLLISPGGRVPVDGGVVQGHSFVDESRITGESMPVEKAPGAQVFAGSINQSGALEIRTERIGRDTSYGRILEAVENAERSRAPVQRLADRLAGYLVAFALGAAALTFIVTRDARSTISVVIVAGACGVAAGTPLALLGAIGRCARLGAIVKGGLFVETLGRVDTIVLDKTGTLTFGRPEVKKVLPTGEVSRDDLLRAAASAELRSEHPLGRSLVAHARMQGVLPAEPERFVYTPGEGVSALVEGSEILVGNDRLMRAHGVDLPAADASEPDGSVSEVRVARRGQFLGRISIADTVRPEAMRAVRELKRIGLRVILLTGDARGAAEVVASALGIQELEAGLLPEQKRTRVHELVQSGRVVAMVGDGINDAPALTQANVGVAMGSGTDVARESADIVLLGNDLEKFAKTVAIARWTRRVIWQNFTGTILVDACGITLAALGLLNPLLAASIHVASELAFLLNSTRLLPGRRGGVSSGGQVFAS
jgi:Cd2+/Zn2+-exporting ATPase/Cu+-exporting ATPase